MAKITKKSTKSSSIVDGSAAAEPKVFILNKEGYDKLVTELDYLKNVKRREVAERIREAISYGDLSENSEYEDSKNEQAFVEGRILELEEKVKYVQIIEDHKKTASVQLGSTVKIKNTKTKVETEFVVVGSTEADPLKGKISNVSPVGSSLLDKHVGEVVTVHAPSGLIEYEIMKIQ